MLGLNISINEIQLIQKSIFEMEIHINLQKIKSLRFHITFNSYQFTTSLFLILCQIIQIAH